MKMQNVAGSLLISLALFVLSACSSPSGIAPITIDGIELQVIAASLHESLTVGSQEFSPKSSGDLLLLVRATISGSDDEMDLGDWKAQVQDESGRVTKSDMVSKTTGTVEGQEGTFLEWFFAVDEDAQQITLKIGEHEIDLSPILDKDLED
ncbi:MAG: hypothetical protein WD751_00045 [Anaerolineales bacterium]